MPFEDVPPAAIRPGPEEHCAECATLLHERNRVVAGDRLLCTACDDALRRLRKDPRMSQDIDYAGGVLGAVLAGTAGVLVWWLATIYFGSGMWPLAIGIGWPVAWCAMRFAGGKRSRGLQVLAATVTVVGWHVGAYLVGMTDLNLVAGDKGDPSRLSVIPGSLDQALRTLGVGIKDTFQATPYNPWLFAAALCAVWRFARPFRPARPGER